MTSPAATILIVDGEVQNRRLLEALLRPEGYPQGLKGEAILLESRIMAVADIVESMSTYRPYRLALGIDKALAEIERGRGTAYDPDVADVCLKLFRESAYEIPV